MLEEPSEGSALHYTNRHGHTYYLHEGRTKSGRPRYLVRKSIGEGALATMPDGFEFAESINGVVSVRRVPKPGSGVLAADVDMVRTEVARHDHLRGYAVDVRKSAILVHEPIGAVPEPELMKSARHLGVDPTVLRSIALAKPSRFEPVMKFERAGDRSDRYVASRMTYRGEGGWHELALDRLGKLVQRFVRHIGTDGFFEMS